MREIESRPVQQDIKKRLEMDAVILSEAMR